MLFMDLKCLCTSNVLHFDVVTLFKVCTFCGGFHDARLGTRVRGSFSLCRFRDGSALRRTTAVETLGVGSLRQTNHGCVEGSLPAPLHRLGAELGIRAAGGGTFANGDGSHGASSEGAIPGMILSPLRTVGKSTNILWQGCIVKRADRQRMLNQKECVIWITGLSGSGKSALACALDHSLLQRGKLSYVLDGDNVRHGLNNNLGFSAENIRRVGEVAKLFADTGVICIASFISPYRKDRDACRSLVPHGAFIEVFMDVALEVCKQRDSKGLFELARAGKSKGFTGVDDPLEAPEVAEIVMRAVNGVHASLQQMTVQMMEYLEENAFLRGD